MNAATHDATTLANNLERRRDKRSNRGKDNSPIQRSRRRGTAHTDRDGWDKWPLNFIDC